MSRDIPLATAMLCWNHGFKGATPNCEVVLWPDKAGASDPYQSSVGACFSDFRKMDARGQKLQLMIDAWHVAAFYDVPIAMVQEALLVIPEYRSMLAEDCLPRQFAHERQ
jgi:hypothetical protein